MSWPRPRDAMRSFLAIVLLAAFQVSLFWLFQWEVPQANRDLVVFMLGQLSGFTGAGLAFYFNTSKSSADKNEILRLPPPEPRAKHSELPQPEFGFDQSEGAMR